MLTKSNYTVTLFAPKTPIPHSLLHRFKALRLDALISSPASFVSNYQHERTFTDEEWTERIMDPVRHHLICKQLGDIHTSANQLQHTTPEFEEGEWAGMFTFLGPLTREEYDFQGRTGPSLGNDTEETRWHLVGLYIKPEHRCKESAIATHEAILDHLRTNTEQLLETVYDAHTRLEKPKRARVAGSKPSPESSLMELYESLGGYDIGWAERSEALRISGNVELANEREKEGDTGSVLIMEKLLDC